MQKHPRYRLVAAIDASDTASIVLEHAIDTANRHDDSELHVLRVLPRPRRPGRDDAHRRDEVDSALERIESELRALAKETFEYLEPRGDMRLRLHAREGNPAEEILELAAEVASDVLVIGRHGEGRRPLLGSVPERVVRYALCPVIVAQPPSYERYESDEACSACAELRAESDGEVWFCRDHRGDRRWRTDYIGPVASRSLRGSGGLWG